MCYAKDYRFFDDQKKAEDTQVVQERRAGLIARLLNHGILNLLLRSRLRARDRAPTLQ